MGCVELSWVVRSCCPRQEEALRLRQMALANQVHELTTELARSRAEAAELQAIAEEVGSAIVCMVCMHPC